MIEREKRVTKAIPFPSGFCRLADSKIIFLYLTPEDYPNAVYSLGSVDSEGLEGLFTLKRAADKFLASPEGLDYSISTGHQLPDFLRREAQILRSQQNRSIYVKHPNIVGFLINQEALRMDFSSAKYKKYMYARRNA